MTTTTSYGTWNRRVDRYSLSVETSVIEALTNYPDINADAVASAYREAINAALPDSVTLAGNEFYGPYVGWGRYDHFVGYPVTADDELDIAAIVASVDFWDIVEALDIADDETRDTRHATQDKPAVTIRLEGPPRNQGDPK